MNGGAFTVVGGFWAGATSTPACIWQIAGCPSDYDNSGGSDGDDIIAFFADWDAGEPCSDVDESGGTDSDDERKLGDARNRDVVLSRLVQHFSKVTLKNANLAEPDMLGRAYEYLIEKFADDA